MHAVWIEDVEGNRRVPGESAIPDDRFQRLQIARAAEAERGRAILPALEDHLLPAKMNGDHVEGIPIATPTAPPAHQAHGDLMRGTHEAHRHDPKAREIVQDAPPEWPGQDGFEGP